MKFGRDYIPISNKVPVGPSYTSDAIPTGWGNKSDSIPTGWGTRHTMCLMCFLGSAVAFAMRINISVAIIAMTGGAGRKNSTLLPAANATDKALLPWSPWEQGMVLGSSNIGYFATQLLAGVLSDRIGAKWSFGAAISVPSLLNFACPLVAKCNLGPFTGLLIVQGMLQGGSFTILFTIFSKWFSSSEQNFLSSIVMSGTNAGILIWLPLAGWIIDKWGWEFTFYISGAIGCTWFFAWLVIFHESPKEHPFISKEEQLYISKNLVPRPNCSQNPDLFPLLKWIFSSPAFLALLVTHMAESWMYSMFFASMPDFLLQEYGISIEQAGLLSSLPYLVLSLAIPLYGRLADRLLHSELLSKSSVRKLLNSVSQYGAAAGLVALSMLHSAGAREFAGIAVLCITLGLNGAAYTGLMMNYLDLSPNNSGTLIGIGNTLVVIPAILSPMVTGFLADGEGTEHFIHSFEICALVLIICNSIFVVFGTAEEQDWTVNDAAESGKANAR